MILVWLPAIPELFIGLFDPVGLLDLPGLFFMMFRPIGFL